MNNSIVDYLNQSGQASDFATRKRLAEENGITGYTGSAQQNLNLLNTLKSKAPKGQVLGVSTMAEDAPSDGGASGRFDGLSEEEAQKVDELYGYASQFGTPSSEIGDFYNDPNYRTPPPPPISAEEQKLFGRAFGDRGNDFAGLTRAEAEAKAKEKGMKVNSQLSAYTTYSFNPETVSGAKSIFDGLVTKVNDNNNDPFKGKGTKADYLQTLFESSSNEFAKLFTSVDEFNSALTGSPEFKATIDNYVAQGGKIDSITSKIKTPPTIEDSGIQDVATYLEKLSPNATPEQKQAYETLIPEKQLAQEQIMQLAKIPKELKDLYFGTPEKIGLLEEKRIQAEEFKKIIEKKAKDAEDDARAQAQFAIDQNNADLEIESAKVETNRLKAKNYMTGMLAKMGALNTTGSAVLSLGVLDQKYEQQAQLMRTKAQFKNREIQNKLQEYVHDLENKKEETIYTLKSDLTKDKETVIKEVFKVEQQAQKEIFSTMSKYTTALRVQTEKYRVEAEKEAKEYAKKYGKIVANGITTPISYKVTSTSGKKQFSSIWSPKLETSRGTDGYVDPAVYENAFKEWVNKGGDQKTFILAYPPKNFINPVNNTVQPAFRTTPKTTAKGREI
jgi:hypothetical protein